MKILILDDLKARHQVLTEIYKGHDITNVYSYLAFVHKIGDTKYDLIYLDHDLGSDINNPDVYIDGWGIKQRYTGYHAATALCGLDKDRKPARVVVHSLNPIKSKSMVADLKAAGIDARWEPFGQ